MSIRKVLTAALLVSAALTMTACDPESDSSSGSESSAGAASKPGAEKGGDTSGGDQAGKPATGVKYDKDGCPIEAPGHKFIWAKSMKGNVLTAQDAKLSCNRKMNEGAFFSPSGQAVDYTIQDDAKIEPLLMDDDKTSTKSIRHLQVCVAKLSDPLGEKPEDPKEKCSGNGPYDVKLDAQNNVSEITELITS
ncbi:hypothetical protein ACZ90_52565 [Streptomyces albus subsp. albus]|nr:hypothetical protein ACZ90_52565 [Streptomyces albus subsp. albus]